MDIFAIAAEGMRLQEEELKQQQLEEQEEEQKKQFKLDIKEVIRQITRKNYRWYKELGENQKHFQPYILNLWLSKVFSYNKSNQLNYQDMEAFDVLLNTNTKLNTTVFSANRDLLWLISCTIADEAIEHDLSVVFTKGIKDETAFKTRSDVIKYIADMLWTSKTKVEDMIHRGLITQEDHDKIAADLDTITEKKKK